MDDQSSKKMKATPNAADNLPVELKISEERCCLNLETNNDNVVLGLGFNQAFAYNKRQWNHFLDPKDEELFKRVSKSLASGEAGKITKPEWRIMRAFCQLYQEYSFVADTCLQSNQSNTSNVIVMAPETSTSFNTDDNIGVGSHLEIDKSPSKNKSGFPLLKEIFVKGILGRKSQSKTGDLFDIIQRYQNKPIEVFLNKNTTNVVSHRILIPIKENSETSTKEKWFAMPIALELLLPKVQQQIERIMCSCSFLCDPLEVVAELRSLNYDENACITYFQMGRNIRDIIEEFMPKDGDNILATTAGLNEELNAPKNLIDDPFRTPKVNIFNDGYDRQSTVKIWLSEEEGTSGDHQLVKVENTVAGTQKKTSLEIIPKFKKGKGKLQLQEFFAATQSELGELRITKISLEKDLIELKRNFVKLSHLVNSQLTEAFAKLKDNRITDAQRSKMIILSRQVEELKVKLKEEEKKRRQIYNILQENLGNIRVYCRCRNVKNMDCIVDFRSRDTLTLNSSPIEDFTFERVFSTNASQGEIYEEFRPLVNSFIDGYNVSFITYGGEATGKTYTLVGSGGLEKKEHGLLQRALCAILKEQKDRSRDWELSLSAVAVEVYNETYLDMLSGNQVHIFVEKGLEAVYQLLKSVPVESDADVEGLLGICRSNRRVAKTALNPASSRSHLVCIVRMFGRSRIHGEQIRSYLSFVDLAGFEDIIKAQTHNNKIMSQEASFINKSLTAFNRVFVSLQKQDPNKVCYRDTKLTHLLKPFLTNSSKCSLIVTVRTDKHSVASTQSSLRFGRETRGVNLGRARRQISIAGLAK